MLLGFHGPAGAGKDECGKYLIENYGYAKLSFAAPIYDALEAMGFGRPTTQAEKEEVDPVAGCSWRHLAQTLGTEWGRELVHPHLWLNIARRHILLNPDKNYVVTDVRFENEAEMIRQSGGRVVHLKGRKDSKTPMHASESGLLFDNSDITLHNDVDGVAALHDKLNIALRAWL